MSGFNDAELQALITHGVPVKIDMQVEFREDNRGVLTAVLDDQHEFEREFDSSDRDSLECAVNDLLDFAHTVLKEKR